MIATITWVDVLRSVVIGQSVFLAFLATANVFLTLHYQKPRPGRFLGLVLTSASFVIAVALVIIGTVKRFGLPHDYYVWSSLIMVSTGTLGFCLLVVHSILHSDRWSKILANWLR
jgi:hypothetical protein